jgi:hypothetical protein
MLMNTIKKSYREMISHVEPIQPVVTVSDIRPAANTNTFGQSEMQARRLRRQRRMDRMGQSGSIGWKVRTW